MLEKFTKNYPLKNLCWYGVGGNADYFIEAKSQEEFEQAIQTANANKLKYLVVGGGSNIAFCDEGYRGVVIKFSDTKIDFLDSGHVRVSAGTSLTTFVKAVMENGFTGPEGLYGLPGTVGGAVFGNAGAHGVEISNFLVSARVLGDTVREEPKDYFAFSYRHSKLHETKEVVLSALFSFEKGNSKSENAQSALNFRKENQPSGKTNGSFFKNPKGDFAGRLIDAAGLKGCKIGGAFISEKHANFFMNDGSAKCQDLIDLRNFVIVEVNKKFGITLESEVRIFGTNGELL